MNPLLHTMCYRHGYSLLLFFLEVVALSEMLLLVFLVTGVRSVIIPV